MYFSKNSKVIVQGITGSQGKFHSKLMQDYGTNIVAGVTPKKGGQQVHGIPVYNTVFEAVREKDADTSIIFVPAKFTFNAVKESLDAGITLTCIITENVPVFDMVRLIDLAGQKGLHLVGPNCPGVMIPGKIKLGRRFNVTILKNGNLIAISLNRNIQHLGQVKFIYSIDMNFLRINIINSI